MTIALINPNTNATTTQMMLSIAQQAAPLLDFTGLTAALGPGMITDGAALDASADEVIRLASSAEGVDAVIVSAFGDPGVLRLRQASEIPVIGIGGAAARLAARSAGSFAVVTTTAGLAERITALMSGSSGATAYLGTFVTPGDPQDLMQDAGKLDAALLVQIAAAARAGAERVIIGGGPLGMAAERLAPRAPVPLINPIRAAVREMSGLLGHQEGPSS